MKKLYIISCIVLLSLDLTALPRFFKRYYSPEFILDSVYEYHLDAANKIYKSTYSYYQNLTSEIITSDLSNQQYISRQVFEYNSSGLGTVTLFQLWDGNSWINSRRDLSYYYEGKVDTLLVQVWKNNGWVNSKRYVDYEYNSSDQVEYYMHQTWSKEAWLDFFINQWVYNDRDQLIERHIVYSASGEIKQRVLYLLNEEGLRSELVVQVNSNGKWINQTRRVYHYNNCGLKTSMEVDTWDHDNWDKIRRLEYFYSPDLADYPFRRVPVCHKGHTIWVSRNALKAHLDHGNCLGSCTIINRKKTCSKNNFKNNYKSEAIRMVIPDNEQTQIYPNPFSDQLTILVGKDMTGLKMIELVDFSGRIIMVSEYRGENEIIIHRNNLYEGMYLLRFVSDQPRTEKILIK